MKKLLKIASYAVLPLATMMMFSAYSGSSSNNPCPPGDYLGSAVLLPVPGDCSSFYSCSNGVPILMRCPDGLHFNRMLGTCDVPEDAGCEGDGPISMYPCESICDGEYNQYIEYNICPDGANGGNVYGQCFEVSNFAPSRNSISHHCYRYIRH